MRTLHLFAGAGGGLYADLILGHEPVGAVEWSAFACDELRARADAGWWPGLRVHECDVRMFNPSDYAGRVDQLAAGFPCQDISLAGSGHGIGGARSGLWSEVVRVVDALRPSSVWLENSPAITSRGLDVVLSDLAALGFDAEWLVLTASAVGAPHFRARWFCLAQRGADDDGHRQMRASVSAPGRAGRAGDHGLAATAADADRVRLEKHLSGEIGDECAPAAGGDRGYVGWWSVEPGVGRLVHGVADRRARIEALGNGQVPMQAACAQMMLRYAFAA
ncbi:MAG: DNA cytosine methyltransferase [Gammaproteobacteria bacterium]|nr:DNA cytosine methyltransferase [Gammaproteobacteria bacterium]